MGAAAAWNFSVPTPKGSETGDGRRETDAVGQVPAPAHLPRREAARKTPGAAPQARTQTCRLALGPRLLPRSCPSPAHPSRTVSLSPRSLSRLPPGCSDPAPLAFRAVAPAPRRPLPPSPPIYAPRPPTDPFEPSNAKPSGHHRCRGRPEGVDPRRRAAGRRRGGIKEARNQGKRARFS